VDVEQVGSEFAGVLAQLGEMVALSRAGIGQEWPAEFASVGTALHPGSTEELEEYWAHGKGAAKIRWPEPCAFCRCLERLTKYFPKNPKGLCANLEKRATGHWPNAGHSHTKHCPC
jgi:hypothetical protein